MGQNLPKLSVSGIPHNTSYIVEHTLLLLRFLLLLLLTILALLVWTCLVAFPDGLLVLLGFRDAACVLLELAIAHSFLRIIVSIKSHVAFGVVVRLTLQSMHVKGPEQRERC